MKSAACPAIEEVDVMLLESGTKKAVFIVKSKQSVLKCLSFWSFVLGFPVITVLLRAAYIIFGQDSVEGTSLSQSLS